MGVCSNEAYILELERKIACASSRLFHIGIMFTDSGTVVAPKPMLDESMVHAQCAKFGRRYWVLDGDYDTLVEFVKSTLAATKDCSGEDDERAVIKAVEEFNLPHRSFNNVVTAIQDPKPRHYPGNIPQANRIIWDTVIKSQKYLDGSHGKPAEVKWSLAVRLYSTRCVMLGVKPFGESESLESEYADVLDQSKKLEQQLRKNLMALRYIDDFGSTSPWRFVEVSYNNSNYVIVLERVWNLAAPGDKVLRRLVRAEGFKKNEFGAGYIHPISRRSMLRVRVKRNIAQVPVQMFIMFTKPKIVQMLNCDPKIGSAQLLSKFTLIAKKWFATGKF